MSDELEDEIEVINSIYGPLTLQPADPPSRTYILRLPRGDGATNLPPDDATSLRVRFPEAYPLEKPEVAGTHHSSGGRRGVGAQDQARFAAALSAVYTPGSVCVFDALEEFARTAEPEATSPEPTGVTGAEAEEDPEPEAETEDAPEWTLSEVVVESKSTFLARVARVTAPEQPGRYLAHLLRTDRRARGATHNMLAWRVRLAGEGAAQDFDDDGETAAGGRLLRLMQAMGVWDAMVVVTRWYGGVKLGPRRFAVINGVARDGFVRAGMVDGKKR